MNGEINMDNIRAVNGKIKQVHEEIVELLEGVMNIVEQEFSTEQERMAVQRIVDYFELCTRQMEALRNILSTKMLSEME